MHLLVAPLGSSLLDGLTVPAFPCQAEAGVVAANGPAGALLVPWARAPLHHPVGDLLGCLNAREAGCGRGARCATCPVRAAIRRAAAGEPVEGIPVAMELERAGGADRVELRVSARPVEVGGARLALLTLEPVEWVA